MKKKYDFLVFIGRFQPFHKGHLDVVEQSLEISDNLIIVMGSHDRPLEFKNPFTTEQRVQLIQSALTEEQNSRIRFCYQTDHIYNEERWLASIQSQVSTAHSRPFRPGPTKIGIVGYNKDHSSFYLRKFPMWDLVDFRPKNGILNATDVRNLVFSEVSKRQINRDLIPYICSEAHGELLLSFVDQIYEKMRYEQEFLNKYKRTYGPGPFLTADALVTQAGHILVVERGSEYGGGLWALPGGFVNPKETFREAVLRELFEETQIDVPKPVLNGSIDKEKIFDDPDRSSRGRIVTMCSHFKLNDRYDLPKVKGSDDADNAEWITISDFMSNRKRFFEDHFNIIENMLGI